MISHKKIEKYLLSMPDARLDYPFGENTAVYKVNGNFAPKV
jgi:predicted DNA-binding protein (MmcQ/YjbR family)